VGGLLFNALLIGRSQPSHNWLAVFVDFGDWEVYNCGSNCRSQSWSLPPWFWQTDLERT